MRMPILVQNARSSESGWGLAGRLDCDGRRGSRRLELALAMSEGAVLESRWIAGATRAGAGSGSAAVARALPRARRGRWRKLDDAVQLS